MYFDLFKSKEPESPMMVKPARVGIFGPAIEEKEIEKLKAAVESQKTAAQEQTARTQKFADLRAKADKRTWETETKPKDEFLEGFNYYSEKKEEPQKVTMEMRPVDTFWQSMAARNKYADSKVMEKPKDDFLEGFYYYDEGKGKEDAVSQTEVVKPNEATVLKGIGTSLLTDPLATTPYKFIDRYEIFEKYKNLPQFIDKNGNTLLQQPHGRFGIASREYPEITKKMNRVNAVYRIDNADGSNGPHRNLNQYFAEEYNPRRIDETGKKLAPLISDEALQKTKQKNAKFINDVFEKTLDGSGGKQKIKDHKEISKGLLNVAENSDKIAKAAKIGGKTLGILGTAMDVATVGNAVYLDIKDDNDSMEKGTAAVMARVAGEATGAALGAKGGAAAGAWIGGVIGGAFSGGLLAAPGAAIGGVIGGFIGGIAGSYGGGWAGDWLVDALWK